MIQVDRPCERQLLWDTMAQTEPRSKVIRIRFVVTAADLSADSELQPAKLDDRAGILPTLPRLAAPGFHGDLPVHSGFRHGDNQMDPANARPIKAHVARLNGCALSILGREDWWMWIVRYRHGTRVEGKTGTFAAAKSAAVATAMPLTSLSRTAGTALTAAPSPQAS